MFLTCLVRASVAFSIATVLANADFALAAEQSITPMAGTECEAMARKISQAAGIKLSTNVGGPDFVADFLPGVQGNACLMSGRATGLNTNPYEVENKLYAVLSDWTRVPDNFSADGPIETIQGFAKGAQRVVFHLNSEPPRGTCQNIVIAACKVPARRWIWTLKVVAFSISSQSGM
jgi:hypothetical protein